MRRLPELREAALPFGFREADFTSIAAAPVPATTTGPAAWVFSFIHDNQTMLYRFKQTGELLPVRFYKSPHLSRSYIGQDPDDINAPKAVLEHLEKSFDFAGPIADAMFIDNLRLVFRRAPAHVQVFVLLGNELGANMQGEAVPNTTMINRTGLIREAAQGFANVETVSLAECLDTGTPAPLGNNYQREVYYKIYRRLQLRMRKKERALT